MNFPKIHNDLVIKGERILVKEKRENSIQKLRGLPTIIEA